MPRTARATLGGIAYHVMNRGNGRMAVFHDATDYETFWDLIGRACERLPMPVLACCLMPNHFHMVLWPAGDDDLGSWMQWLMTAHVRRHHKRHESSGHLWQGRFKAFPAQSDSHLLTVIRYVERNPLRANLVGSAEVWQWSSLRVLNAPDRPAWLHDGPSPRPDGWVAQVNQPQSEAELAAIRRSIACGAPFGSDEWAGQTATRLGLAFTRHPGERPGRNQQA